MADLVAQGEHNQHRWRRALPDGEPIALGRAAGVWSVPWDDHVSRKHVQLCWREGRLQGETLPGTRNPVFVAGRKVDRFALKPGQHFVVGRTTFTLTEEQVNISVDAPLPATEQAFSPDYLKQVPFRHADQRIDVLSRLPEIISGAGSDTELFVRLVNMLLTGIPRATAAALIAVDPADPAQLDVLHWDRRALGAGEFCPSQRLIQQAVERSESVVHVWRGGHDKSGPAFTQSEDVDWAFCTPLSGKACRGWAIYIAGRLTGDTHRASDPNDLRDDLKFAELAATTLSNLREVRLLERRHAGLSQFFSPLVLDSLVAEDPDVALAPRETEVSVLFCDLRGFSRESERSADDLLGLLRRVSQALGVMTQRILAEGGVVGDFHGDAAMGFWGWPIAHQDAAARACRAALAIQAEFEAAARRDADALADFRIGIGIATGRAVAGKIGTVDQVKVTVFGPVVNLASRLEGMTKSLRAAILLDEATAAAARTALAAADGRVRRLAVVRPYGMETSLEVSELLPAAAGFPQLTDEHLAQYERALDALLAGRWSEAYELLHKLPAEDRAIDFLTVFIAQHNRTAPSNWDGVIPLTLK